MLIDASVGVIRVDGEIATRKEKGAVQGQCQECMGRRERTAGCLRTLVVIRYQNTGCEVHAQSSEIKRIRNQSSRRFQTLIGSLAAQI